MSNQNYQKLRQMAGGGGVGRKDKKIARFTLDRVKKNTTFEYSTETAYDPQTQQVISVQESNYFLLDCGHVVYSPQEIRGVCAGCAGSLFVRITRRYRFVCKKHPLCRQCQRRFYRRSRYLFVRRALLSVLLWPVADVWFEDEQ